MGANEAMARVILHDTKIALQGVRGIPLYGEKIMPVASALEDMAILLLRIAQQIDRGQTNGG
jgi:hypothetical protein